MTKEKKIALALAGTLLLGATGTTLSGCGKKEKSETQAIVSETSIDTKDIVVIDTYNDKVVSKGINERYLILYKNWVEHDPNLDLPNNESISYVYRDVNNSNYIGMFTEYSDGTTLFVYGDELGLDNSRSIAVIKTTDKTWYGNLSNLIDQNSLKIAYEVEELIEIYNALNENYIKEEPKTYNNYKTLSYTFKLN